MKLPAEALKAVAEKGIENVAESLLGSSELTAWAESLGDLGDGWRWVSEIYMRDFGRFWNAFCKVVQFGVGQDFLLILREDR